MRRPGAASTTRANFDFLDTKDDVDGQTFIFKQAFRSFSGSGS
jgi:hypothetical protein